MPPSTYEFGPFSLDLAEKRLSCDGHPVPLTPKVFDLLRVLVENAGHLVEKEQLLNQVWSGTFVEEANLNRAVSVLRKVLGETSTERFIETVPKRGYRFVAAVHAQKRGEEPRTSDRKKAVVGLLAILAAGGVAYYVAGRPNGQRPLHATTASVHRQLTFTGKEVTPTLSPDGRHIAYVSSEVPHRKVVVQQVDGGHPIVVFSAPEASALRWSPDSSELLFWARGEKTDGTYIASRSGGAVRKVGHGVAVTCWSPDGSTIAVALFGPQKIRFINRLGDEQRTIELRGSRDWIWDMDWSPVHDRLLFVATDDQRRASIWSIRSDGTEQTKILSTDREISAARWAHSGNEIYYFTRVKQTVSVFKASASPDSGAAELATPLVSGLEGDGSYGLSADATRLVYARAPYYSNLWLVEADSKGTKTPQTTQLTNGTAVIERPRVSPDGASILFNMGYESQANLYTMPATGAPSRQLTFFNAFSIAGVWSPDGRSVAFASTEGGKPRIWTVDADGGSPRAFPATDVSENFNLAWAPGPRLLYQKTGYVSYSAIDPATRQQQLFLAEDAARFVCCPEYSPDGKRIVVYLSRPRPGLYTIDRTGSNETLIHAMRDLSDSNPVPIGWSADAQAIYACDGKRAAARGLSVAFGETVTAARIIRIPLDGGPVTNVVDLPFEEVGGVAMFPDGRRFVASVYSSRSDVWMVENFDVAIAPKSARRAQVWAAALLQRLGLK